MQLNAKTISDNDIIEGIKKIDFHLSSRFLISKIQLEKNIDEKTITIIIYAEAPPFSNGKIKFNVEKFLKNKFLYNSNLINIMPKNFICEIIERNEIRDRERKKLIRYVELKLKIKGESYE